MNDQEKQEYLAYLQTLNIEQLRAMAAEMNTEISGLGEMAESARLSYAEFGPTEVECESEIASIEKHLRLIQAEIQGKEKTNA